MVNVLPENLSGFVSFVWINKNRILQNFDLLEQVSDFGVIGGGDIFDDTTEDDDDQLFGIEYQVLTEHFPNQIFQPYPTNNPDNSLRLEFIAYSTHPLILV